MNARQLKLILAACKRNGIDRHAKKWRDFQFMIRVFLEKGYLIESDGRVRVTLAGREAALDEDDTPSRFSAHRSWWEAR